MGIVEKQKAIDGKNIKKTDVLIGLPSNGLHTNGYSLARKVLLDKFNVSDYVDDLSCTTGEELLKVHKSYLNPIQSVIEKFQINGISHVTGGGIEGNTKRILSNALNIRIDWSSWDRPAIFSLIKDLGKVPEDDMRRTFNLGIGIVFIVSQHLSQALFDFLSECGESPCFMGEVI